MIHFDDLLVARIVNGQMPQQRNVLMAAMNTLHDQEGQRGLLAVLVAANVLTMQQAQVVHGLVERTKREKLISVYAYLLTRQGIPGPQVRQYMDQLGVEGDAGRLAELVLAAGLLQPDQEQQLRFQAKMISDQDQAQQLKAYLASRGEQRGATPENTSISGVYTLPAVSDPNQPSQNPAMAIPQAAVTFHKASAAMPVPQLNLEPPRFEIPDWIDTSDPRTGESLNDYRILGRIGAGAMGIVYLADHPEEPERPVALKLLPPNAEDEAKGRFKREILANSFFSHPGIIDVFDAGQATSGHHYLAMEFFDGEDLAQILESEVKLQPTMALGLCRQMFEVLGGAHGAGIVHRDVKPENMLVSRDGKTAKLMDFGIAIIRDLGEFEHMVFKTVEGGSTGTPQFMSPEQAAGDQLLAPTDIYSMGLVLYQCLTGRLPYDSETASGFMACHMMEDPLPLAKADKASKGLPRELHDFFDQVFDKVPNNRPTAGDAVALIDAVLPKIEEGRKKGSSGRLWGFLWKGRGG